MLTILDDLDATRGVARVLDNVGTGALLLEDGVGGGSGEQQGRGEGGDGETHRGRDRQSTDVRGDSGDKVRAEGRATKQRQNLDAPRGGGLRWRGMERDDPNRCRTKDGGWQVGRAENTTGYLSSSFLLSSPLVVDQDSPHR